MGEAGRSREPGTARPARLRWCGAGIVELLTPEYRDTLFIDTTFWSNTGWDAFGLERPREYATVDGFVGYVRSKRPEHVLIAVTHDHDDHTADYFEAVTGLVAAGVNVQSVFQRDLVRVGLRQRFVDAGVDLERCVVFGGKGCNIGGVPLYCSGDTDLFGDIELIGRRYDPDVAVVCIGNGRVTMGPRDAAEAVRMSGARVAMPVHYGHNPPVRAPDAGPEFAHFVTANDPRPPSTSSDHEIVDLDFERTGADA